MKKLQNIKNLCIDNISLEELDSKFFHFCSNDFLDVYDSVGMSPQIGNNSKGIDNQPSIFFSRGVEGILELWDVWFKWKLNRIFNPQYKNSSTNEEVNSWFYYFCSGEFINNDEILNITFDVMEEEMLNSSYYLIDLKENEDFIYEQVDSKKEMAILKSRNGKINPMVKTMYGKYSDFSTAIEDKWNMQTIPGKELIIRPDRIKNISINGKTDVVSILLGLYNRYKKEVDSPLDLPILDKFVNYEKNKENSKTIN